MTDAEYFAQVRAKKAKAEPHLLPFMDVKRWKDRTVLDVGCGLGTQSVWFAQAGAEVTATDFSEVSCDMAIRHALASGVSEQMIVRQRNYDVDFIPRRTYDLIWAWGSLHHMRGPRRVLAGLRAHCAHQDTRLKVMLYHSHSTKVLRLLLRHGKDWRHWTEANGPVPISNAYSVTEAVAMIELAGWQVDNYRISHIFPWKVSAYKRGEFVKGFPYNLMPEPTFRRLEERWGFHILLNARPR